MASILIAAIMSVKKCLTMHPILSVWQGKVKRFRTMYDLREHKELISRLVSEANRNDPNWEWSVRRLSKNVACIFWGYLEYCDEAELSFSIKLGEADGRCWVEARNEHGWILESEIVADKNLPFLNCPIDKAIEKMVRCIVNTAKCWIE
jgi:hypothetical protein